MSGAIENVSILGEFEMPWNKQLKAEQITYGGGMTMLRLRIREGRRFTDLELRPENAEALARVLTEWAEAESKK